MKVARSTESGRLGRDTGWTYAKWKALRKSKKASGYSAWDKGFRDQASANVNVSVNAMAALLASLERQP